MTGSATRQSILSLRGEMDCFVASAPLRKRFAFVAGNDGGHTPAFPRRDAPELYNNHPPQRAWGMPGAQCTRSLAWEKINHTSVVTTGPPEKPGIPARNGFNGFLRALPGDEFVLPPSPAD
jgi:hypothetical protein